MTNPSKFLDIIDEIRQSDAAMSEARLKALLLNFRIFDSNFSDLGKLLQIRDDPRKMLNLWDDANRPMLEVVVVDVLRRLHNFLESACSLVEKNRRLMRKWYKNTELYKDYDAQLVTRFRSNTLTRFIEDLRVFNFHYSLPVSNATFKVQWDEAIGQQTMNFSFVLVKPGLLVWKGWSKGKEFLQAADDEIDIALITGEYHQQVSGFYSWLVDRFNEFHKVDFAWLEEMRQKAVSQMDVEERKIYLDRQAVFNKLYGVAQTDNSNSKSSTHSPEA